MIRNRVKTLLDDVLGISIAEAQRRTGMNYLTVGRLYRNELTSVTFESLDQLCAGLGVTIADVLEFVPENEMTLDDVEHLHIRNQYLAGKTRAKSAGRIPRKTRGRPSTKEQG